MRMIPFDKTPLRRMTCAAICLALCMVLPFLTGQLPQLGSALSPMHIPVFLAGFLCGPWWALAVGIAAPLLRSFLFGMPPLFPTGAAMCVELAVYGAVSGLAYRRLEKNTRNVYVALLTAMLSGRIVWGAAMTFFSGLSGSAFTWGMFLTGAFFNAIPAILLHIVLVPALILALRKAGAILP